MLATSARFLAMLRVPHVVVNRATIEQPGRAAVIVPVIGGSVAVDVSAASRRTGSIQVPWSLDEEAEADLGLDLRTLPFGAYVFLERGVRWADGSVEVVPVGRLRINAVSWRTSEGIAALELSDRMAQVAEQETTISPKGVSASEVIQQLVQDVFGPPGERIEYHILTDPASEPDLDGAAYEGDYAKLVTDLADSVGAQAYFDAVGDFVLAPAVNEAAAEAVWDIDAGAEGVFIDADESLDRTETFSFVTVRGQTAAGAVIEGTAFDNDPASPTYYLGPFGRVELVYDSAAVKTQAQADTLAADLLGAHKGLARSLALSSVPNPALEPGDTVRLLFDDGREELHLLAALTVPLDASASMAIATRSSYRPALAKRGRPDYALAALLGARR